jgi:hypothetical protein
VRLSTDIRESFAGQARRKMQFDVVFAVHSPRTANLESKKCGGELDIQLRHEGPFTLIGRRTIIDAIAHAREHDIGHHAMSNAHAPPIPNACTMRQLRYCKAEILKTSPPQ